MITWKVLGGGLNPDSKDLTAFAIYDDNDSSFTFYAGEEVPEKGSTYKNHTVTNVYTGFDTEEYNDSINGRMYDVTPWNNIADKILHVIFDDSYNEADIKPISTHVWFKGMYNVTSIDLSYLNTSNVTDMSYMFRSCEGLKTINGIENWDTSNVTDMSYMFDDCHPLTSLDVSNWDTSNVTDMAHMFDGCGSLKTIYSDDNNFVTDKVSSSSDMFNDCMSIVGSNGTVYNSDKINKDMAHVDTADNPGYFTAK